MLRDETSPTEPIGSIPRPTALIQALARGYAPFSDDTSSSRDVAFAKIRARVAGTALAAAAIEGRS